MTGAQTRALSAVPQERTLRLLVGDCRRLLAEMPDASVQCVVTSPPYWGLRDYGHEDQLGREATPQEYVRHLVEVFGQVRRVLRSDGTLWLNLGDCFTSGNSGRTRRDSQGGVWERGQGQERRQRSSHAHPGHRPSGPPKQLLGIPWRVALALQDDGWFLRSDIVWAKPNPMPESVRDRPTRAHEYLFLLTPRAKYFYDCEAVREPAVKGAAGSYFDRGKTAVNGLGRVSTRPRRNDTSERNHRSVWTIPTASYSGAHFAVFPPALVERCIRAGTPEAGCCSACGVPWRRRVERRRLVDGQPAELPRHRGQDRALPTSGQGIGHHRISTAVRTLGYQPGCACGASAVPALVLDPFGGSGTTGGVALALGRSAVLCELSPSYAALVPERVTQIAQQMAQGHLFGRRL